jgi:hypothetical protein
MNYSNQLSNSTKRQIIHTLSKDKNLSEVWVNVQTSVSKVDKYYTVFEQKYKHVYSEQQWDDYVNSVLSKRESNIQENTIKKMLKDQRRLINKTNK